MSACHVTSMSSLVRCQHVLCLDWCYILSPFLPDTPSFFSFLFLAFVHLSHTKLLKMPNRRVAGLWWVVETWNSNFSSCSEVSTVSVGGTEALLPLTFFGIRAPLLVTKRLAFNQLENTRLAGKLGLWRHEISLNILRTDRLSATERRGVRKSGLFLLNHLVI